MESTAINIPMSAIVEPINDEYEYIQYNEKLRLIHSINDDMYQMQSILTACNSKKQAYRWRQLAETNEILDELSSQQNCCDLDTIQDRPNLPNDLKDIIYIIEKSHGL